MTRIIKIASPWSETNLRTQGGSVECVGEDATMRVGALLGARLAPDGIVFLRGDLGAGKTIFVKGIARSQGIDEGDVVSPTFTLVANHQSLSGGLIHLDLYRLDKAEAARLGLEEILANPGIKAIEWPDRIPFPVEEAVSLFIEVVDETTRRIHGLPAVLMTELGQSDGSQTPRADGRVQRTERRDSK